jgi:hypothetical protein
MKSRKYYGCPLRLDELKGSFKIARILRPEFVICREIFSEDVRLTWSLGVST